MKSSGRYFWFAIIFAGLVLLVYAFYEYNRKHSDLSSVDTVASTSAVAFVTLYETDEQTANKLYLGKPVDVTGVVAEINTQQDRIVNLLLGNTNNMHNVSCLLDVKHTGRVKEVKIGDEVTVRGICTGYLIDVELNRCVIIPKDR